MKLKVFLHYLLWADFEFMEFCSSSNLFEKISWCFAG